MSRYDNLLRTWDEQIRAGHAQEVRQQVGKLPLAQVPREYRLALARICRRSGSHSVGLKLLWRIVNPSRRASGPATAPELAEYGVLLLRSGAVPEALLRLHQVSTVEVPEVALYQAYGHFVRWEYDLAVPLLETYINAGISDYAKAVGRANLAMAHLELRQHQRAMQLLDENIHWLEKNDQRQLLSNCHALRAQLHIQDKDFSLARAAIKNARHSHEQGASNDQFLVQKLDLILQGLEEESLQPFQELRRLATAARDWESLREAELYALHAKFNPVAFLHLYFGTQFTGFRERLQQELNHYPNRSIYILGDKQAPRFQLLTGELNGKVILKPGAKIHQLVEILLRDFYRPQRIAALFGELFPGEFFDINSSPDRVHQIIRRTRRWLENESIGLTIAEESGFYYLRISGRISLAIPAQRAPLDRMHAQFDKLSKCFRIGETFTATDARNRLRLSKTSVFRLTNWGLRTGKLERSADLRQIKRTA